VLAAHVRAADTVGVADRPPTPPPQPADGVLGAVEQLAAKVDGLAPVSDEPGNQVLVDNARLIRWAAPLFALCALALVPWIVVLGITLPQRQLSENYALAWTGYDALLLAALALTAYFALRRSTLLPIAASSAGALLTADAWFDVLTSPGGWRLGAAIAMSVLAELPLAFLCFWLAVHSQEIEERRIVMLLRRHGEMG
jgi:hypothetical protein